MRELVFILLPAALLGLGVAKARVDVGVESVTLTHLNPSESMRNVHSR